MILFHTALLCEAMALIESFKLEKIQKNLYKNDKFMLVVSGIGGENTSKALKEVFGKYSFKMAINIGIAGCKDKNIPIGSCFCILHEFGDLPKASLTSVDKFGEEFSSLLVDMEAKDFVKICSNVGVEFRIIKIVSDHVNGQIPPKDWVKNLIKKSINTWIKSI